MGERRCDAGDVLMRQGDDGDYPMIVLDDGVEVAVTIEKERHELKRAGRREIFGEMALVRRALLRRLDVVDR